MQGNANWGGLVKELGFQIVTRNWSQELVKTQYFKTVWLNVSQTSFVSCDRMVSTQEGLSLLCANI